MRRDEDYLRGLGAVLGQCICRLRGHSPVLETIRGKGMAGDDGKIARIAVKDEARSLLMLFWLPALTGHESCLAKGRRG